MDPVGFGLENYDQNGRYRTTDNGRPECVIKADGNVAGLGAVDGRFKGPSQLADVLLKTPVLGECLAKHFYQFSAGRDALNVVEQQMVTLLLERTRAANGDIKLHELFLEWVSTEAYRHAREP
jgi:hypothetical protein